MTISRVLLTTAFALAAAVFACPVTPAEAADYYVAVNGDDTHPGSLAEPFATIARAQQAAAPGDTVHIRGGTYTMTESQIGREEKIWAYGTHLNKSGKPDHRINYFAEPGELPIFDFSNVKPPGYRITAFHITGSWIHIKGLAVVGVQVTLAGHTQSICFDNQGSNNIYENLSMHDGQAIGFWLGRGSDNLILNCDAYRNHDYTSEDHKGGNVDGFGFHAPRGSVRNIFRGCRAWFNSDDGFDCITAGEPVTIENCWAFYNGYNAKFESLGDGNGFKAGGYAATPTDRLPNPIPHHVIRECLAVRNKACGFYANHHPGGNDWFNNTAYRNGTNFNMTARDATNTQELPGYGHVLKNNLAYKGRNEITHLNDAASDASHNSFNLKLNLTNKDFLSIDESELTKPRQPDGSLPEIQFLHPAPGSAIIDAGIDVDLPFKGAAPDLGAFESTPAALNK